MNISGKITVNNKKRFGKYNPLKNFEEINFGAKKLSWQQSLQNSDYEELAGINELDTGILNTEVITSKPMKLEIQLVNSERKLKKIKKEIKNNEIMQTNEFPSSKKLYEAQKKLKKEITAYRKQYRELGLTYKIADTSHQAEMLIINAIATVYEGIDKNSVFKKVRSKISGNEEKQRAKTAKLLVRKIEKQMNRSAKTELEEIEHLFIKAEKLMR